MIEGEVHVQQFENRFTSILNNRTIKFPPSCLLKMSERDVRLMKNKDERKITVVTPQSILYF